MSTSHTHKTQEEILVETINVLSACNFENRILAEKITCGDFEVFKKVMKERGVKEVESVSAFMGIDVFVDENLPKNVMRMYTTDGNYQEFIVPDYETRI